MRRIESPLVDSGQEHLSVAVFTRHSVDRVRSIVRALILFPLCADCSGALHGGTFNDPFRKVEPAPAPVYDGHMRWISSWADNSPSTASFTNAITISVDCDYPDAATKARAILSHDSRSVIWVAPMFTYGAEGYELRSNAAECWARERDLIRANRSRSIVVWLLDEPPDVAWSFWVDGGTRYDPNRYNAILTTAAAMIHAGGARSRRRLQLRVAAD